MDAALSLVLLLLFPYLGFFTGLRHLRPLRLATNVILFAGAVGSAALLWTLKVPPLPPLWPSGADFPIQLLAWVAIAAGTFTRMRLDSRR